MSVLLAMKHEFFLKQLWTSEDEQWQEGGERFGTICEKNGDEIVLSVTSHHQKDTSCLSKNKLWILKYKAMLSWQSSNSLPWPRVDSQNVKIYGWQEPHSNNSSLKWLLFVGGFSQTME